MVVVVRGGVGQLSRGVGGEGEQPGAITRAQVADGHLHVLQQLREGEWGVCVLLREHRVVQI